MHMIRWHDSTTSKAVANVAKSLINSCILGHFHLSYILQEDGGRGRRIIQGKKWGGGGRKTKVLEPLS